MPCWSESRARGRTGHQPEWVAAYVYGHRGGNGQLAPVPIVPGQPGVPGEFLAPDSPISSPSWPADANRTVTQTAGSRPLPTVWTRTRVHTSTGRSVPDRVARPSSTCSWPSSGPGMNIDPRQSKRRKSYVAPPPATCNRAPDRGQERHRRPDLTAGDPPPWPEAFVGRNRGREPISISANAQPLARRPDDGGPQSLW